MREVLTRREWAGMVAAVPVVAQVASSPASLPAVTPAGKLSAAEGVRKASDDLAKIALPMSIEPAFRFQV